MNIIVTGCAGFIGSHLVDRLLADGHYVYGIDNLSNGCATNMAEALSNPNFKFQQDDIRKPLKIDTHAPIDTIVHLAACGSVPRSMKNPGMYMSNNILGFHHVLEYARVKKIKNVYYASSSSVYGNAQKFYRYESDPHYPCSPYAASKCINEVMAETYERCFFINTFGLRFFNVFGPRQKLDSDYAAMIPKFCKGILQDKRIEVFGDGRQIRTFTPIGFVIEALALMIGSTVSISSAVLNITHEDYAASVLDTAHLMSRFLGDDFEIDFLPERPGDVKTSIGSGQQLIQEFNEDISPQWPAVEALRETCEWYKEKIQSQ